MRRLLILASVTVLSVVFAASVWSVNDVLVVEVDDVEVLSEPLSPGDHVIDVVVEGLLNESFPITVGPPALPATEAYPNTTGQGLTAGGGYDIFTFASGVQYWHAFYWAMYNDAQALPYASDTIWVDGDRSGYRCAYGFIGQERDNPGGTTTQSEIDADEILGRVTFIQIPEAAAYAKINDSGLQDGARHYADGSFAGGGELGECPQVEIEYEPYTGSDQRPRIGFWLEDWSDVLDIRDYTNTNADSTVIFEWRGVNNGRATVIAHIDAAGSPVEFQPAVVIYYDEMNGGHVTGELEE